MYTVETAPFVMLPQKDNDDTRITNSGYIRPCPQVAVGIAKGGILILAAKSSNSVAFAFTVVTNGCSGCSDASRLAKVTGREYRDREKQKKSISAARTSKAHLRRLFWDLSLRPRLSLRVLPPHDAPVVARVPLQDQTLLLLPHHGAGE